MNRKAKIVILLILILTVLSVQLKNEKTFFSDADIFWHLKLSQSMVEAKALINTAEETYAAENLPYVPHETLFQFIIYFAFNWFGWAGLYFFFALSFIIFVLGLYKLSEISREEVNLKKDNDYFHIFMLFYLFFMFFVIVDFKVITISMAVIVWYVVWLKKFMKKPSLKIAMIIGLFSLLLSNLHGGTWIVSFVFFIFVILDGIMSKKLTKHHFFAFVFAFLGGIINVGGIKSILYAWEVGEYKDLLLSFQAINFSSNIALFTLVVIFVLCAKYTFEKSWFEKFFVLGIFYLGLASPYQNIYLIIFLPYFVACAIEKLPVKQDVEHVLSKKHMIRIITCVVIGMTALQLTKEETVDKQLYPVDEMNYILKVDKGEEPPKILADYVESGYILYRGGKILADPRLDPYINEKTKGIYGWTAVERQYNAFRNGFLEEEIRYQKPDYVLVPKMDEGSNSASNIYLKRELKKLGKPVYKGSFGEVYKINKTAH